MRWLPRKSRKRERESSKREREAEERRQRAADAALRRLARRDSEEEASAPLQAEEREREDAVKAEELRRRAADAAMRRAERLAAGGDAYEVVEVDATSEQSLADSISEFSGVEISSDDANKWLLDESDLEPAEAPGACVVVQEHRVEWVVGLRQPIVERPPSAGGHEVVARDDDDDDWNDEEMRGVERRTREIPMYRPQEAAAREVAVTPPSASRSARRRARRYNPNRHLEREDYVSARANSPSSEEAGPPINRPRKQRAIEPPLARGVGPQAAQQEGPGV